METDEKTGRMKVKACMTPDGKTIPMGEKAEEQSKPKRIRHTP